MKRNDIYLLAVILIISVAALGILSFFLSGSGETVVVSVDGEEYARLPLSEDTELLIKTDRGTNLLIIKDGEARVTEASCPDKICVNTGAASDLKTIVCIPNRVSISIEKE